VIGELRFTVLLPGPIDAVFGYFADPRNLNLVTPDWFQLDLVDEPVPALGVGSEIDYRMRVRGWRTRWRSRFVEWEAPTLLTYEQALGPYRSFRHEHHFASEVGGTRMTDVVAFRAPLHPLLGGLVRRQLEAIFRHRERRALEIFTPPAGFTPG
jgi:ligand-binding SRPBCC domain-containing protein